MSNNNHHHLNMVLAPKTSNMHVGASVTIFGLLGTVTVVEPETDYTWSVEIEIRTTEGALEMMTLSVPTDFRTTDGHPVTESARLLAAEWEREAFDAADDRLHRIESMACDR